jgi:Na+/melibiose symporter-like transporter
MVGDIATTRPGRLGRSFQNLFVSNLATNMGDGVIRTAAPLLAARLTTDPLLISLIAALALLPWLFFAIPAGIVVDRIDRRLALGIANGVRVLLATALVVLYATHSLTIVALYVVIFVDGACETIYDGSIRAMVPSIVPKALLPVANSRIEAGEVVLQQFLAAPFTSLLFAISVLIPLGTNIGFYAIAVVLALLLPRVASGKQYTQASAEPRTRWYRQFVDGYHFIMANRMLRTLWFFSTFIGLCFSAATAGFVLFLFQREALPQALFGVFMLTGAAGGILGSLLASRFKKAWGAGLAMAIMNLLSCVALVFVGTFQVIWVAAIGFFVSSACVLVWNVLVMSLRQSLIPGRLLGRVHGTWRTLLWGTMPLGSLIGGLLGRVDLALPFLLAGGVATVASILFFRFLARLPNAEDVDNGDRPVEEIGPGGIPLAD